jgi:AcrR family transcriptional regulator
MLKKKTVSPRKKPSQARSWDTVEAILEAAAQVFTSQGYEKTTTNHIAERAGVCIGSLYEYFPNKDSILHWLLEMHVEEEYLRCSEIIADAQESQTPLNILLKEIIEARLSSHMKRPGLHRVIEEEMPFSRDLYEVVIAYEKEVTKKFEEVLRDTPGVKAEPSLAATLISHCLMSLIHWYINSQPEDLAKGEFINEVARLFYSYLFLAPMP